MRKYNAEKSYYYLKKIYKNVNKFIIINDIYSNKSRNTKKG